MPIGEDNPESDDGEVLVVCAGMPDNPASLSRAFGAERAIRFCDTHSWAAAIDERRPAVVIVNESVPQQCLQDIVAYVGKKCPDVPVVRMSGDDVDSSAEQDDKRRLTARATLTGILANQKRR